MKTYLYDTLAEALKDLGDKFEIRHEAESPFVFLTEVIEPKPEPLENHTVNQTPHVIDLDARTLTRGWEQVEIPPPPPPEPPIAITPRQLQLALLSKGITPETIESMLAGNAAALIEWRKASEIRRDHPLVLSMAGALNMTEQDLADMFLEASTI